MTAASPLVSQDGRDAPRPHAASPQRRVAGSTPSRAARGRSAGPRSARIRALHAPSPARRPTAAGVEARGLVAPDRGLLGPLAAPAREDGLREAAPAVCAPSAEPAGDWSAARFIDRRGAARTVGIAAEAAEGRSALVAAPALRQPRATEVGSLRLTRRGALVLGGVALAAVIGLLAIAKASAPPDAAAPASVPAVVTVHEGDTLWSIAAAIAPQRDPRAVVGDLRRINALDSVDLQPGQLIRTR